MIALNINGLNGYFQIFTDLEFWPAMAYVDLLTKTLRDFHVQIQFVLFFYNARKIRKEFMPNSYTQTQTMMGSKKRFGNF